MKLILGSLGVSPAVTSITPSQWGVRGGTTVTLTGTAFASGTTVSLGGSTCNNPVVTGSTQITCTISYHGAAAVDVVVTNPDGQTGTLVNGFKYNAFLYASASSSNRIYGFVIDSLTTAVATTSPAFYSTCNSPYGIEIDPTNQYLYVACYGGKQINWFSINHADGSLTSLGTINAGTTARAVAGLATNASGTTLFAGVYEATGKIQAYSLDQSTGTPTFVQETNAGSMVSLVSVDPYDRFVYGANNAGNTVVSVPVSYAPGPVLGSATTTTTSLASSGDGIFAAPGGSYVYMGSATSGTGHVYAFSVNPSTGALTEIDRQSIGDSNGGSGVVTDATATQLYVTAYTAGRVYGFTIGGSGTLSPLSTPSWVTGGGCNDTRVQSLGGIVVTANRTAQTISVFVRDLGTGLLTLQGNQATGTQMDVIAITY